MKQIIKKVGACLCDLLFPPRCAVCDGLMQKRDGICLECLKRLKVVSAPWCIKCGRKLSGEEMLCKNCSETEHKFTRGRAIFEFESVQKSIYRFKYGGRQEYARFYGAYGARLLQSFLETVQPDALIPVPLHKKRQNKRGYNQAALFAKELGKHWNIPVYEDVIFRRKNTIPLKKLSPLQRENNLKNAFIIKKNDVKLKTIIIIDDIYTSGSTIDEIAATFLREGVENIYFVVLACGVGF